VAPNGQLELAALPQHCGQPPVGFIFAHTAVHLKQRRSSTAIALGGLSSLASVLAGCDLSACEGGLSLSGAALMSLKCPTSRAIGLAIALVACSGSLDPRGSVVLRSEVSPGIVSVGDTVTLRAIMHNVSDRVVDVNTACGPPVLFELRRGTGEVVHPISPVGVFTCEGRDYHVLEPFEVDTVLIRWRVNLTSGAWDVRSGFRNGPELARLSAATPLTVQDEQ
jgi:hypothetical protein